MANIFFIYTFYNKNEFKKQVCTKTVFETETHKQTKNNAIFSVEN